MILITVKQPYGIITSIAITNMEESVIDDVVIMPVALEGEVSYSIQMDDPRLTPEVVEKLNVDATQLLFDGAQFKIRPYITLEIVEEHTVQRDGAAVLQLNQPYTIKATYHDPDNVGFDSVFSYLKFKDRTDTITVPSELHLDANGEATATVQSAFPGISKFRAKDDMYLCWFLPLLVRFKA